MKIAAFYQFRSVADPAGIAEAIRERAAGDGLVGRIYVADEGVNASIAGADSSVDGFIEFVADSLGFDALVINSDPVDRAPFAELRVKVRPRLVNMGAASGIDPNREGGRHLEPEEWRRKMAEPGTVILDVRNEFEGNIGRFKGAVIPPHETFAEFPSWAAELSLPKDTPILMYCTGGIRCEKFSGVLMREGYTDVNQLHGGILRWLRECGPESWEGSCFVFDDRMIVDPGGEIVESARCTHCDEPTNRYLNCANMDCHSLTLMCDECAEEHHGCCSEPCKSAPRLRKFQPDHLQHPYRRRAVEEVVDARESQ